MLIGSDGSDNQKQENDIIELSTHKNQSPPNKNAGAANNKINQING